MPQKVIFWDEWKDRTNPGRGVGMVENFSPPEDSTTKQVSSVPTSLQAPTLVPMMREEGLRSFLEGTIAGGKNLLGAEGFGLFLKGGQGESVPVILACSHAKEALADMGEWKGNECVVMNIAGTKDWQLILAPIFCWSRNVGGVFYSFSAATTGLRKLFPTVELLAGQVGALLERAHLEVERVRESVELEDLKETLGRAKEASLKVGTLATLGKLISVTIHEIFNPLSIISLSIEKLFRSVRLSEDELKTLALIRKQVERIEKTAQRLRFIPRRPTEEMAPVQVEQLLKEVSGLVEPELERRNVRVGLIHQGGAAHLLANRNQLTQLFLNLIHNGQDAMPEGGTLTIGVATFWREGKEWVELRFSDTGCGIPRENLPRVFDQFFSTKPEGKGMGLGLSICQEIVSAHGGRMGVSSEPGRGTTFTVELPSLGGVPPSQGLPLESDGKNKQWAPTEILGLSP